MCLIQTHKLCHRFGESEALHNLVIIVLIDLTGQSPHYQYFMKFDKKYIYWSHYLTKTI